MEPRKHQLCSVDLSYSQLGYHRIPIENPLFQHMDIHKYIYFHHFGARIPTAYDGKRSSLNGLEINGRLTQPKTPWWLPMGDFMHLESPLIRCKSSFQYQWPCQDSVVVTSYFTNPQWRYTNLDSKNCFEDPEFQNAKIGKNVGFEFGDTAIRPDSTSCNCSHPHPKR